VQIWDAETISLIRTMTGHSARVGALAWNNHLLSSGSRDRAIYHRDVRVPAQHIRKLCGHKQEVCGLKWNADENQLASGGNDNKLFVWSDTNETPLHRFNDHTAAVKAIAWNPHQHGILASGGGTADKRIRFWNTLTGSLLSEVDTGSQVCNLVSSPALGRDTPAKFPPLCSAGLLKEHVRALFDPRLLPRPDTK
jgi:cell division cycle 20-like protein 1 (cofactor of APC complex)